LSEIFLKTPKKNRIQKFTNERNFKKNVKPFPGLKVLVAISWVQDIDAFGLWGGGEEAEKKCQPGRHETPL
jgi:hypothetical protein